jgi:polar amino acid transport system permease protein
VSADAPGRAVSAHAPRRRGWRPSWLDLLLLALVAGAVGVVAWRIEHHLNYRFRWDSVPGFLVRQDAATGRWVPNLLLAGLLTTLRLTFWASLLAGAVGLVVGLMSTSERLLPRLLARTYVESIRNVPNLVFLFVFYYFVSAQLMPALGIEAWARAASPAMREAIAWLAGPPALLGNFAAGVLCLAMLEAAYVAEIVRAGIQAVPRGQWEAAATVGLSRTATLRDVVLPQAVGRVLPPLAGQFISLVKDSSLVSIISIQELTFIANEVTVSTGRVFEVWLTAAALYFLPCLALSLAFRRWERRARRGASGSP